MIPARSLVRGNIVLVPFPFTDLTATKRRPAVIVAVDQAQTDVTLAFISSQNVARLGVGEIALLPAHPEYALSGLVAPCKVRATKLVTLDPSLIVRRLGRLGPLWTADLDRALVAGMGINTVPYWEEGRQAERRRLATLHAAGGAGSLLADLGLPASWIGAS